MDRSFAAVLPDYGPQVLTVVPRPLSTRWEANCCQCWHTWHRTVVYVEGARYESWSASPSLVRLAWTCVHDGLHNPGPAAQAQP